jgi:translation initiation factor eIF-2B subunit delta
MPLPPEIAKIRSDNTSGSARLTRSAAEAIARMAETARFTSAVSFRRSVAEAAHAMAAAQPAMAPMVNLASAVLHEIESSQDLGVLRKRVASAARSFTERIENNTARVAEHGATLVGQDAVVLTHSSSEAVFQALLAARTAGGRFETICTESRPMNEGAALARRLARHGIRVTLIADAAMLSKLGEASVVLVGADAVTTRGLVNKTGTALLALAARKLRKRMYALCGSEKFLPAGYLLPPEPAKNPAELLPRPARNVTISNYYFDLTPLDSLSGIVCEDGILRPGAITRRLGRMKIYLPELL